MLEGILKKHQVHGFITDQVVIVEGSRHRKKDLLKISYLLVTSVLGIEDVAVINMVDIFSPPFSHGVDQVSNYMLLGWE